jgi:hypothetical protein
VYSSIRATEQVEMAKPAVIDVGNDVRLAAYLEDDALRRIRLAKDEGTLA